VNSRAFGALVRREIFRGRQRLLACLLAAVVGIGATVVLLGPVAILPATLSLGAGLFAIFGPIGDLRNDKVTGNLEFDRVLPISHRAIATARFVGTAVRTTPIVLFAIPIMLATAANDQIGVLRILLAVAIGFASWVILTALIWALMAINIRWNLRNLWWVPMTIGFAPQLLISVLPPETKAAIRSAASHAGNALVAVATSPIGGPVILVILVATPFAMFFAAVSLYASGLERYTYTESTVQLRGPPPKRELGAIGRGPMLAVAGYCIRLATEQSRKRLILLAIFVIALLFGSQVMQDYARLYVRALAAMIPGAIMIQLGAARARGDLEGLQQLPHPAITTAAGHLIAVAVLAVPGAAVWTLARYIGGDHLTAGSAVSLLSYVILGSWLAAVGALWLTRWRLLAILSIGFALLAAWAWYLSTGNLLTALPTMAANLRSLRATAGVALPIALSVMAILVGLPLFARGLEEYQVTAATKRNAERWAARRRGVI
jgi:hypothetical protein